jgi:hypothetical protein
MSLPPFDFTGTPMGSDPVGFVSRISRPLASEVMWRPNAEKHGDLDIKQCFFRDVAAVAAQ